MGIVKQTQHSQWPTEVKQRRIKPLRVIWIVLLCILLLGVVDYFKPVPPLVAEADAPQLMSADPAIAWPSVGEASVGIPNHGVLADSQQDQKPLPAASIAKVMASLVILEKYPLKPGEQGPMLTVDQHGVDLYNTYAQANGSFLQVSLGEQISEYQALQAMLLPSANNIADMTALWAYGSMDAYHTAANALAAKLGMTHSHFADDASGFSPGTTATAHDLVLLGEAALKNPVIAEIVAQPSANLPIVGDMKNVNWLLTQNAGYIGIKTGNTDQAGGCFLFATKRTVANQEVTVIGAVMGQPMLHEALLASEPLANSVYSGLTEQTVIHKGAVLASYTVPWAGTVHGVAARDISLLTWKGSKPTVIITLTSLTSALSNQRVGSVSVSSPVAHGSSDLVLEKAIAPAPALWRLLHF